MIFMVIETFKHGDTSPVGERFRSKGRMLPEGVGYIAGWVEASGAHCFQIMEAPDRASLDSWSAHWNDLVDFEIIPVMTSNDYWATVPR